MFKFVTIYMKIMILNKVCLGSILNPKQATLYSNTQMIIDTFDGVLLNSEFTFNQDFQLPNPCQTYPQKITIQPYNKNITQIINQAFELNFVDGHYESLIPKLIGFAKVGLGIIVLSQQGALIFYTQQNNKYDIRSLQQYQELDGIEKAFIEFLDDQILILSNKDTWILKPNFSQENIFENAYIDKIHMQIGLGNIHKLKVLQNYLFITFFNQGFGIYKLEKKQLQILQKVDIKTIIDTLIIVSQELFNILILDSEVGIHFYFYNHKLNEMHKNKNMTPFMTNCSFFDYIQSNLYLLIPHENSNMNNLSIFNLNFLNSTLNLKYSTLIEGTINGMQIIKNHVIFYDNNQITVLYGSFGDYIKFENSNFLINGIKQLILKQTEQKQNQIIGITNNQFFALDIHVSKINVGCLITQDYPDQFSFNYVIQTVLPTETYEKKYDIFVIFPLKSTQRINLLITFILTFVCLIITILVILLFFCFKYSKFKLQSSGQFQELGIETLKTTKRSVQQQKGNEEMEKDIPSSEVIQTCLPASRHPINLNDQLN